MLERMNKCEAIIGGDPPRQQPCIVDSLWANIGGPLGTPDTAPHRLIMGTFGPAVDYLTVKKIRIAVMGDNSHNMSLIEEYLTRFGLTIRQLRH